MGKLSVFPEEIAIFKNKTGKRVYNQKKILLEMAVLGIGTKLCFITEKKSSVVNLLWRITKLRGVAFKIVIQINSVNEILFLFFCY